MNVFMTACQNLLSLEGLPATHRVCALGRSGFRQSRSLRRKGTAGRARMRFVAAGCADLDRGDRRASQARLHILYCLLHTILPGRRNAHQFMVLVPMQGQCMLVMARPFKAFASLTSHVGMHAGMCK